MENHLKKMRAQWDENTTRYRDPIGMTGRRPVESEFRETVKDVVSKIRLDDPMVHSILDVGCNNGYLLKCLNVHTHFKLGIDFSMPPLQEGRSLHPDMYFVQGEVSRLPVPDNSFDRVVCYNMFHYLPSQESGLSAAVELFRVVRTGGRLLIGDLFTQEHKHLIPEADLKRWDSPERPFMHRIRNWMFISLRALETLFHSLNAEKVCVIPQKGGIRCPGYRYDIIIDK